MCSWAPSGCWQAAAEGAGAWPQACAEPWGGQQGAWAPEACCAVPPHPEPPGPSKHWWEAQRAAGDPPPVHATPGGKPHCHSAPQAAWADATAAPSAQQGQAHAARSEWWEAQPAAGGPPARSGWPSEGCGSAVGAAELGGSLGAVAARLERAQRLLEATDEAAEQHERRQQRGAAACWADKAGAAPPGG